MSNDPIVRRRREEEGLTASSVWPEDFVSNYSKGSVGIILALALQRRGVEGIEYLMMLQLEMEIH